MKAEPSMGHVRIYRAVFGAVRNTAHGHPRWRLDEIMARSIAKRAAGTLTAQWPEVLAAHAPSDSASELTSRSSWPPRAGGGSTPRARGTLGTQRPPFRLRFIRNRIGNMAGIARKAGNIERERALVEVLRLIGEV